MAESGNAVGYKKGKLDEPMASAKKGKLDEVRAALDQGVDVNYQNEDGWTALVFAAWNRHEEVVAFLLERGADLTLTTKATKAPWLQPSQDGLTVKDRAKELCGNQATVVALLEAAERNPGQPAATYLEMAEAEEGAGDAMLKAAAENTFDEVSAALARGVNVNFSSDNYYGTYRGAGKSGTTALILAVWEGHEAMDGGVAAREGGRGKHHARAQGGGGALLSERGAELNLISKRYGPPDGYTALTYAAAGGHEAVV
eukprot:1834488-Prymnesium_polylepis.1